VEAQDGHIEESLRALEDERAEKRAIVRVYILDPAALTNKFASTLSFWLYGDVEAGHIISFRSLIRQYILKPYLLFRYLPIKLILIDI